MTIHPDDDSLRLLFPSPCGEKIENYPGDDLPHGARCAVSVPLRGKDRKLLIESGTRPCGCTGLAVAVPLRGKDRKLLIQSKISLQIPFPATAIRPLAGKR